MSERISEIRTTSGNHPVSSMVLRKADALNQLVQELTDAEQVGWRVDPGRLAGKLRMLVADLRGNVAPAVAEYESDLAARMGAVK